MLDKSERAEDTEEQEIPGRKRRRVVRNTPCRGKKRYESGGDRAEEASRDRIDAWQKGDEENEERKAKPDQVLPEDPKYPRIDEGQPSGVQLGEVTMRYLAVENPLCGLR